MPYRQFGKLGPVGQLHSFAGHDQEENLPIEILASMINLAVKKFERRYNKPAAQVEISAEDWTQEQVNNLNVSIHVFISSKTSARNFIVWGESEDNNDEEN